MILPFNPQGYGIDILRSCYETDMFIPGALPSEIVRIRWFFTDRPMVPFRTYYGSRNWHPHDAGGGAGEIKGATRPWRDGSPPGNLKPFWEGPDDAYISELPYPAIFESRTWCFFIGQQDMAMEVSSIIGDFYNADLSLESFAGIGDFYYAYQELALECEAGIGLGYVSECDLALECEAEVIDGYGGEGDLALECQGNVTVFGGDADLALECEADIGPLSFDADLALEASASTSSTP